MRDARQARQVAAQIQMRAKERNEPVLYRNLTSKNTLP
jgi:hypothetical protein